MRNKAFILVLLSVFTVLLTACGKPPQLYRLAFNDQKNNVRGSIKLDSTYNDENIIWTSSDNNVIEIKLVGDTYRTTVKRDNVKHNITLTALVGDKKYTYNLIVAAQSTDPFYNEYPSINDPDHIYETITYNEMLKLFESGTHVLYLGFPTCPWCIEYTYYFNLIGKELGVESIKYYNFQSIRVTENLGGEIVLNGQFQALVDLIDPAYLSSKTEGDKTLSWIFAPTLYIISDGEVIAWQPGAFDGHVAAEEPLTGTQLKAFQTELETRFQTYLNALN